MQVHFYNRAFPSANMILVCGKRNVLIDSGFGSDADETLRLLRQRISPRNLHLIVNTHYHSDHVGGNALLQARFRLPVAAHPLDATLINRQDPSVCGAEYLDQAVEPYSVTIILEDEEEILCGDGTARVLHTPGHTRGHLSLYFPQEQVLILGDLFHRDDVGWLCPAMEGNQSLENVHSSIARLRSFPVKEAFSGHGPKITDFPATIARALDRYEKWFQNPTAMAWHASKRIFAYALMISGGMREENIISYLAALPWWRDFCREIFKTEASSYAAELIAEMIRSKAARWIDGKLVAATAHNAPSTSWTADRCSPEKWHHWNGGRRSNR